MRLLLLLDGQYEIRGIILLEMVAQPAYAYLYSITE